MPAERPGYYQRIADQERDERRHAYEHRVEAVE